MTYSNYDAKKKSLDMVPSTARNRLVKILLFDLLKKSNLNICYRCNKIIEDIDKLTIDHKQNWLYTDNAIDLYFDVDNISYSHHSCNAKFTRKNRMLSDDDKWSRKLMYQKEYRLKNNERINEQRRKNRRKHLQSNVK